MLMADAAIINPRREQGEPEIPAIGILCVVPSEIKYLMKIAEDLGGKRHYLFNSNLITVDTFSKQPFFVAGPAVGSPMAVLAMEKLVALGAKKVIVYGWCGSLTAKAEVSDVLIPTWCVSEEGTSKHYPLKKQPSADKLLNQQLMDFYNKNNSNLLSGPLWTTDAPYRETPEQVETYRGQGIIAVEMEFAALLAVASYRNIVASGVMVVSDELWREEWKPGFKSKKFRQTSRFVLKRLVDFIRQEC